MSEMQKSGTYLVYCKNSQFQTSRRLEVTERDPKAAANAADQTAGEKMFYYFDHVVSEIMIKGLPHIESKPSNHSEVYYVAEVLRES